MDKFSPIRCPIDRPHGQHESCGRLHGVVKNGRIFLYCEMCKRFYEMIVMDNDHLEFKPLQKNIRLNMQSNLRMLR